MTVGNASGIDEILNEVWKFGRKELRKWAWIIYNRVWKGEGWSEIWREGIVVRTVQKGKGEGV